MRRIAIAVLLAGLASADPKCRNPVVHDPHAWGERRSAPFSMNDLELDDESHPHPDDPSACKALEDEESCCSEKTLEAIESYGERAGERIERAEEMMEAVVEHISNSLEEMAEDCSPTWCDEDVKGVIEEYQGKLKEVLGDLAEARVDCMNGLAAYMQGMLCFTCLADYEQYLDEDGHVIHLAHATCDATYASCKPTIDASIKVVHTLVEFIRALLEALGHDDAANMVPARAFQLRDMCNGTDQCKEYFCHHHLNGFALPMPRWGDEDNFDDNDFDNDRRLAGLTLQPFLQRRLQETPPATDGVAALARHHVETLAAAVDKVGYLNHAGGSNEHNSFSSDGYDAFAVGCEDRNCPQFFGTSFPYWFIGVIAGLLIIIGIVTALYIRHRRAQNSKASGQEAQNQQGAPGAQDAQDTQSGTDQAEARV